MPKGSSPGARSSRGNGKSRVWETRRAGLQGMEIKSNREEISAARRAEVYRTDVEFAGTDVTRQRRIPKLNTPERVEFDARIGELVAQGLTFVQIGVEMGVEPGCVSNIVKRHDFKGPRSRS
jgi:hypothetical protein